MQLFFAGSESAILVRKTYGDAQAMGGGWYGPKMAVYVMSRTLPAGERNGYTFTDQAHQALVEQIRKSKGKDIWMMGGGELVREFLKADLIDELYLGVVPVLLGEGIPLFPSGFPQRDFALIENKTFSKGLISLNYSRVRGKTSKPTKH